MKKWIAIIIVALAVVGIAYAIWEHNSSNVFSNYTTQDTVVVETNPWQPYLSVPVGDTESVYEVVWDQKYGTTKTSYCMVVFRNERSKQYKLIAPWLDGIIIEYQNTNDIKFNKVLRKDVPNYQGISK
jgi:uncharacterized protein YxeA